jgi:hypothetical protein
MRFVWPAQRYDRLTRTGTIVATTLTACAAFAIAVSAGRVYRAAESTDALTTDHRVETITFVLPRAERVLNSPARAGSFTPSAAPSAEPSPSDTSSLITTHVESSARAEQPAQPIAIESKTVVHALGPYSATVARTIGRIDSGAAPPLGWGWLPPTQAEKDSIGRAEDQRATAARDDHRPMAIPLGGGGIPLPMPFGGSVRSREQFARDSIVNDDYLRRLARLAERARAKRESTLAARVVAHRDSGLTPKP